MESYIGDVWLVRLLFQRALAAIYLIAFLVVLQQFAPLLGERGLLPVPAFLKLRPEWAKPSLFCWRYSDRLLAYVGWTGVLLSIAALLGVSESGPLWLSVGTWLTLWFLYLSIVNVGQTFYGFGWESMLLEAGFFAAFLGPSDLAPSLVPVLALRWMLFRVELGAGLIKLRHDRCWRNLTCLAAWTASFRTSSATTANPFPCSPARAASIAAFKANKFVCSAMPCSRRARPGRTCD